MGMTAMLSLMEKLMWAKNMDVIHTQKILSKYHVLTLLCDGSDETDSGYVASLIRFNYASIIISLPLKKNESYS